MDNEPPSEGASFTNAPASETIDHEPPNSALLLDALHRLTDGCYVPEDYAAQTGIVVHRAAFLDARKLLGCRHDDVGGYTTEGQS